MFLNNYKAIIESCAKNLGSGNYRYSSGVVCTPYSGDTSKNYYVFTSQRTLSLVTLGVESIGYYTSATNKNGVITTENINTLNDDYYCWLIVGDGTTDVQPTDYKLSGNIIDLTMVGYEKKQSKENDVMKNRHIYTVRNDTGKSVTIGEYGWVWCCANSSENQSIQPASSGSNKQLLPVLFERTKLDTPLTIADGETVSFELVFETPLPMVE